jgi:hypothetical protein
VHLLTYAVAAVAAVAAAASALVLLAVIGRCATPRAARVPLIDWWCGELLADVSRGRQVLREAGAAAEEVQRRRILRQRPWLDPDSDASRGRLWD